MVYSNDEIQERDSVLCGYWCLYYLLKRQKGLSILEKIYSPQFNYFVKQKKVTECVPGGERYKRAKNGRLMLKCKCAECGITKVNFF